MTGAEKPFIPGWLDDLDLSANEFRVACHLWRHKSGYTPSGPSIARRCKLSENTVWGILKSLEVRGLLERKRTGRNQNTYSMQVPPVTAIETVTQGGQSPQSRGLQSPQSERLHPPQKRRRQSPQSRGPLIGNQVQELNFRDSTSGGESLPEEAAYWNTFEALPKVKSFGPARRKALLARRKEPTWQANWKEAIERLSLSSFATGTNDRGWKADFDFFLNPNSFAKIIEGKYDDRKAAPAGQTLNIGRRGHSNGYGESTDID